MARRTHKKSRNGCLECKRRHVKCDERQPICSNCTASERVCEYGSRFLSATPGPPFPGPAGQAQAPVHAQSQAQAQAHSAPTTPGSGVGISPDSRSQDQGPSATSSTSASFSDQPVNMLHVELFHNLCTRALETFHPTQSIPWLTDVVSQSITTPYLANELLAFSALHMSTTRPPTQRSFYRYHAAQLQTHALSIYKEMNPRVTHETCVPLCVFAAVLGIHMLCDTLIYRDDEEHREEEEGGGNPSYSPAGHGNNHQDDFRAFLARFAHFFRLYHGVRAIIGEAWHFIQDTPLAPHFKYGMDLYKLPGRLGLGPGCAKLLSLIERAKLGTDLTKTYKHAIESLQACLNVVDGSAAATPSASGSGPGSPRQDIIQQHNAAINGVTTWPLLLDIEFGDLLEQGRPEALVILAHYGMLLHRFRDSWLFGDSGAFLVQGVSRFLGRGYGQGYGWEEWLEWPNEVVRGTG
ncbi:hypothetical protein BJY00DRAFT_316417 [Aspergillus carlsbadensis]|nr:hypothetical protein BJY00DRAFT_316417 [Aspergillus carlsbadensis]